MAEIKLLPCPFCGADLRHDVELAACDTAGCFVCSIAVTKSVPKRVAAWNTRAAHTAQAAEVDAVNARLIALLGRWVRIADSGVWRDASELSLSAHPVADDSRALLPAPAATADSTKDQDA